MMKRMLQRGCWLALGLLGVTAPLHAAVVANGNYVQAFIDLDAGAGPGSGRNQTVFGASFADTLEQAPVINTAWQASGRAQASMEDGLALRAITSATAPSAGGFSPPSSGTLVRAAWRDALLPAADGAPTSLEFVFDVHADLSVTTTSASPIAGAPNFTQAIVSVRSDGTAATFPNALLGTSRSATLTSNNGGAAVTALDERGGRWDSAVFTELAPNQYRFEGRYTQTVNRVALPFLGDAVPFGAYLIGVALGLQTGVVGGTASVDAFSTLRLAAVQLPGGAALPGDLALRFESGLALVPTPVPLPGSLPLFALLVVGGALHCRRRPAVFTSAC